MTPCRAWRGPCLDWLQHRWPDLHAPPWGGDVMEFRGRRVAVVTGYAASTVPWEVVRGLAEGACRVTRMDICVDAEGFTLPMPPMADAGERRAWLERRGERELSSPEGYTRYKGAKDSEIQWRAYLYAPAAVKAKRPWLWKEEARAASVDITKSWRVEVQLRGRLARAVAAAPTITDAWGMLATRWPDWPRVAAAETRERIAPLRPAEVSSASELAERCRDYVASQARRYARKVGLAPDEARGLLTRVAMEALAQLAACSPSGVVACGHDDDDDDER